MAKAKLWDLDALRTLKQSPALVEFSQKEFELIVFRPRDDDPAYSERGIRRLHTTLEDLEEVGDRHELRVRQVFDAGQAAQRIIEADAA